MRTITTRDIINFPPADVSRLNTMKVDEGWDEFYIEIDDFNLSTVKISLFSKNSFFCFIIQIKKYTAETLRIPDYLRLKLFMECLIAFFVSSLRGAKQTVTHKKTRIYWACACGPLISSMNTITFHPWGETGTIELHNRKNTRDAPPWRRKIKEIRKVSWNVFSVVKYWKCWL